MVAVSKGKLCKVIDTPTRKVSRTLQRITNAAPNALAEVCDQVFAIGDDDGSISIIDFRLPDDSCVIAEVCENDDYISDLQVDRDGRFLFATSGDGTLTTYNFRKRQLQMQSENFESDLTSLAFIKGGQKVVVGTQEGCINIFNWGEWSNFSDRFPGHPDSVDHIVSIDSDIIATACADGKIRAVSMLPNRFVDVIGAHDGDMPIEGMVLTSSGTHLVSVGQDDWLRVWDVSQFRDLQIDTHKNKARLSAKNGTSNETFFDGITATDNVDDEHDTSECESDSCDDNGICNTAETHDLAASVNDDDTENDSS